MINIKFPQEEIQDLVERGISAAETFIKTQKWGEAETILRQILKVNPECQPALRMVSQLLISHQKSADAIGFYEKLLEIKPNDFEALNNVALCYSSIGDHEKAIEKLEQCIELEPDTPAARWNLAIQHKDRGDFETASKIYREGIKRMPNSAELRYNFAINLAEDFQLEFAIEEYKKAIELKPDFASAHFNLSLLNLLLGNYEEGWKGYEWRFEFAPVFKKFKQRFQGEEYKGGSGVGKTILVYNEQGAGDAIQFCRYLPYLKEKGFKVAVEALPELVEILGECPGVDQVFRQRSKSMPKYDCHVSINSLPLALEMYEPIRPLSYLKATGSAEAAFTHYAGLRKIGICWAGNPIHRHDKQRSCHLKHFKPIAALENVKLFSMQKDARPRYWGGQGVVDLTEGCENMGVVDMGDMLINFNYTAAIMACMERIITVDTAVAHLAGAMGLKCHLLLQKLPDWRWGLGKVNPWYPSIITVRQTTAGDYETRLKKIAFEIASEPKRQICPFVIKQ